MRIDCKSVKVGSERFDAPNGAEVHQDGDELVVDVKKDPPRFMPGDAVRLSTPLRTTDGFWVRFARVEVVEDGRPTQIVAYGTHFCGGLLAPQEFAKASPADLFNQRHDIDGMRARLRELVKRWSPTERRSLPDGSRISLMLSRKASRSGG